MDVGTAGGIAVMAGWPQAATIGPDLQKNFDWADSFGKPLQRRQPQYRAATPPKKDNSL